MKRPHLNYTGRVFVMREVLYEGVTAIRFHLPILNFACPSTHAADQAASLNAL